MRYGFFIEPAGELFQVILREKERIFRVLGSQPFCNHPPHSTLFVAELAEPRNWNEHLAENLLACVPATCTVVDMIVFENDPQAQGAHTVAFRAQLTAELSGIQRTVAENVCSYIQAPQPASPLWSQAFLDSHRKYGSPFVGDHWIPHFTISSLAVSRDHALLREYEDRVPNYQFPVNEVSLWQIDGDEHVRLETYSLGEA